jgi:5-methyltetrahydrofolate--homocysteine methyltransferase
MPPKPKGKTTWKYVIAARELRQEETEAERILWQALRGKRLNGLKFRRQHPYEHFILDFFCVEHQLVVELDGSVHGLPDQIEFDKERTKFLNDHGLHVIRFQNEEVIKNLPNLLQKIIEVTSRPNSLP